MGKTKTAFIDDSNPEKNPAPAKAGQARKKVNPNPELESRIKSQESREVNPNPEDELTSKPESSESKTQKAETTAKKTKASKAAVKKGKAKYRSVKYKAAAEKVEKSKKYPLTEAIEAAKNSSYSKFDGSLELHINTNVKNARGLVSLPYASGKKLKVLAFGKGAEDSGADIIGDDAKLNEIIRGVTAFDVIVTTAEWMPKLARAAKVLGPRGLMPSPKSGTITTDLKKAVTEIQSGKVEYKTQKDSKVIHLSVGKVSQNPDEIAANIKILFNAIGKTKVKKAVISPSMGMGVKVDLQSI
ncbi:MAG TPA: hypothetical protein VJG66_03970 [Patescibacteria group bacterium]|nr:hypothetical protein [Patescibacteria group bacterium]